jgi:hypothetical protein
MFRKQEANRREQNGEYKQCRALDSGIHEHWEVLAKTREQRAENREQRSESRDQRSESREQRAGGKEQITESREREAQRARGRYENRE